MPTAPAAAFAGAVFALLLTGCAAAPSRPTPGDPLERVNRATFRFNDGLDRALVRPAATAWERHAPRFLRTGVRNLFDHLAFPTTIVNDLLQFKPGAATVDLTRFALNTLVGLGGVLDPATAAGLAKNDEDFGQTLGRWGVGPGPYLVLPFLGPATLRDAAGRVADAQTDLRVQLDLETGERITLGVLAVVDQRAALLPADAALDAAFDRYAFVRDAWLQRREFLVRDGDVAPDDLTLDDPGDD